MLAKKERVVHEEVVVDETGRQQREEGQGEEDGPERTEGMAPGCFRQPRHAIQFRVTLAIEGRDTSMFV